MKTPIGKECKYYYADFHRGHNTQICRLFEGSQDAPFWQPNLCQTCPVPDILRANAAETLKLEATIIRKFWGFKQYVKVEAWCSQCFTVVADPMRGCPNCSRAQPSIFHLPEQQE